MRREDNEVWSALGDEPDGKSIRETYEEYDVGSSTIGMITDPENVHAWILSNATQPIRR